MNGATVNISFSKGLLKAIDEVAREEARTRSELLRDATRMYIERKRRMNRMFRFWRGQAKDKGLKLSDVARAIQRLRNAA